MKRFLKNVCYGIAMVLVAPLVALERIARGLVGRDVFFSAHSELIGLVPGKTGSFIRNAYYFLTMRRCSLNCHFLTGCVFSHSDVELGTNIIVSSYSTFGRVVIGDWTMIGEGARIVSGKHQHGTDDPNTPFQQQSGTFETVHIGRNCWIGSNAVVMSDVGDNCIVGAGAVVSRPFPANKIIAGNPARVIGDTFAKKPTPLSSPAPYEDVSRAIADE